MISAQIILDSVNQTGDRLTTFVCCFPTFILQQVLTHRAFSRNTSSLRAAPTPSLEISARPIFWGARRKGMSTTEELPPEKKEICSAIWDSAAEQARHYALLLHKLGLSKEVTNRLIAPFTWTHMVISTTQTGLANFFDLRLGLDAQPEIRLLASLMQEAYERSTPAKRLVHVPFILPDEEKLPLSMRWRLAVARCARVSYTAHDRTDIDHSADLNLFDRLRNAVPSHATPFEHVAFATPGQRWANFEGWRSARSLMSDTEEFLKCLS